LGSGKIVQTEVAFLGTVSNTILRPAYNNTPIGVQTGLDSIYSFICPEWYFTKDYVKEQIAGDEIILTSSVDSSVTTFITPPVQVFFSYSENNSSLQLTTRVPITEAKYSDFGQELEFQTTTPPITEFRKVIEPPPTLVNPSFFTEGNTSSPEYQEFQTYLQSIKSLYADYLSRGGQITNASREESEQLLNGTASAQTMLKNLDALKKEANAYLAGYDSQIGNIVQATNTGSGNINSSSQITNSNWSW
jgi:hypothetical protein